VDSLEVVENRPQHAHAVPEVEDVPQIRVVRRGRWLYYQQPRGPALPAGALAALYLLGTTVAVLLGILLLLFNPYLCMGVGVAVVIVTETWILILIGKDSFPALLGCLLVPGFYLVYLVLNWDVLQLPFLSRLMGIVLFIVGVMAYKS
jgi:hypothetical protein